MLVCLRSLSLVPVMRDEVPREETLLWDQLSPPWRKPSLPLGSPLSSSSANSRVFIQQPYLSPRESSSSPTLAIITQSAPRSDLPSFPNGQDYFCNDPFPSFYSSSSSSGGSNKLQGFQTVRSSPQQEAEAQNEVQNSD